MHDDTLILSHWPFVRAHLALERQPAALRLLDFIAEQQAKTLEPTAISAAWLRQWGATAGEAGRARTVAKELLAAGVLHRWRGAGPRPDVWALVPRLERWRVPWRTSARSVAMVIGTCECRARCAEAARFPGQDGWLAARGSRFGAQFALPPSAHQDIREPWRAAFDAPRAASAHDTPSDQDLPPVHARLMSAVGAPPTFPTEDGETTSSSSRHDDDAELRTEEGKLLGAAVIKATGGALWGEPARRLERVARAAGPHLERLAEELAAQTWARSPVALVDRAEALLPVIAKEAAEHGRAESTRAQRRLQVLESIDPQDLSPDMAEELAELRGLVAPVG